MCIPLSSSHLFAVTCRMDVMRIHRRLLQFSLICVRRCHPIVWREGYVHSLSQSLRWSWNQISFISEAVPLPRPTWELSSVYLGYLFLYLCLQSQLTVFEKQLKYEKFCKLFKKQRLVVPLEIIEDIVKQKELVLPF